MSILPALNAGICARIVRMSDDAIAAFLLLLTFGYYPSIGSLSRPILGSCPAYYAGDLRSLCCLRRHPMPTLALRIVRILGDVIAAFPFVYSACIECRHGSPSRSSLIGSTLAAIPASLAHRFSSSARRDSVASMSIPLHGMQVLPLRMYVYSACIECRHLCSHCSDERRCYRRLSFVNCVRIKRGPRHKPSLRLFVVGRAEACVAFMLQGSILCDCIAERENIGSQEPPIASLPGVFMRRYPFRISQILAFP